MDMTDFEQDARQRSVALEARGRLPRWSSLDYPLTPTELREHRRLKACLHLAHDPATFIALVRGRSVPASRVDQQLLALHRSR